MHVRPVKRCVGKRNEAILYVRDCRVAGGRGGVVGTGCKRIKQKDCNPPQNAASVYSRGASACEEFIRQGET